MNEYLNAGGECNPALDDVRRQFAASMNERSGARQIAGYEAAAMRLFAMYPAVFKIEDKRAVWIGPDQKTYVVGSDDYEGIIARITGVAAGDPNYQRALKGATKKLLAGANINAKRVLISALAQDGSVLIRRDDTTFLRVTAVGYEVVPNGFLGHVIVSGDGFEPIGPLPPPNTEKPLTSIVSLFASRFRFVDFADNRLGALLLTLTLCAFVLPLALVGAWPIIALLGEAYAGKTTFARMLMWLFWGQRVQVEPPPDKFGQDSFETALAAKAIAGIDDPDPSSTPWMAEFLRSVTTQAERLRRQKFSDREIIPFKPECRIVLAANSNPLQPTEANASRMVPIWMKVTGGERLPEGTLERAALDLRAQLFADLGRAYPPRPRGQRLQRRPRLRLPPRRLRARDSRPCGPDQPLAAALHRRG